MIITEEQISQIEGLKEKRIKDYMDKVGSVDNKETIEWDFTQGFNAAIEILRQSPPVIQAKCKWVALNSAECLFNAGCGEKYIHTGYKINYKYCPFCGKEIERETK